MLPKVIMLKNVDASAAVAESVAALRDGKLVVFPTETVYGLAALPSVEGAVERLCIEKGRRVGHALPLAISGGGLLRRYVPDVNPLVERMTQCFWPGPLTIVLEVSDSQCRLFGFSEPTLRAIRPGATIGFRTPQHPFLLKVLQELDEPIVLTSANISGASPAASGKEAVVALGSKPSLILDDGPAKIGSPSTVIKMVDGGYEIMREGVLSKERIDEVIY